MPHARHIPTTAVVLSCVIRERVSDIVLFVSPFFFCRLKINCVVMNGVNTDELADFLDFTRDQELDVRFIEWMPFDDNRWKDSKFFSYQVWRLSTLRSCDILTSFTLF